MKNPKSPSAFLQWVVVLLVLLLAGSSFFGGDLVQQGLSHMSQLQLTDSTTDPTFDVSGGCIDLDADNDTSICADTDDEVDFEVAGVDVAEMSSRFVLDASIPIFSSASVWYDDFVGDIVAPEYTEASGTDAQAVQAIVEEQFGVYQITSGDAGVNTAGDAEQLALSLEWQADQGSLVFETRLHLDAAITTVEICVGLTDNVGLELPFTNATDTITSVASDAVAFCFDTNATTDEWWALGVAGDTDATGNAATGTAPVADTYQVLRIEVDSDGAACRFYIDGTLAVSLTANCITVTVALAPFITISSAQTATSHVVDVDYIYVAAERN